MKKLLTILMLLAANTCCLKAQWVSIPDTNFGTWLNTHGYASCLQGNSQVGWQMDTTCPVVITATTLDVDGNNISNLQGIQYWDLLTNLNCYNNVLTSLPPLPPNLQILACSDNLLASLPLLPNSLTAISCFNNQLTSLPNVPSGMISLDCEHNQITSLPALPASLKALLCEYNQLTMLPNLPNGLVRLECYQNLLTSLPTLPDSLSILRCFQNPLTAIPALPLKLTQLWCFNSPITSLPSLPPLLADLWCANNQLTSLPDMPDSLYQLWCYDNANLTCLPHMNHVVNLDFRNTAITCRANIPSGLIQSTPDICTLPLCQPGNPNGCSVDTACLGFQIDSLTPFSPTTCGGSNGGINIHGVVDFHPYTIRYERNGVQFGPIAFSSSGGMWGTLGGLSAGSYTNIAVTDGVSGCASVVAGPIIIAQPPLLQIDSITSTNVSCYGGNNGSACVYFSGGTGPYTYLWDNSQTTQCGISLVVGTYSPTVYDASGCSATQSVNITEPPSIVFGPVIVSGDGFYPDTIDVNVLGGCGSPYAFQWSNGAPIITSSGYYSVTVTDACGCTAVDSVYAGCLPGQCVWPGDADFNGLADNNDLLPIGLAYGTSGTSRSDQSIGWYAHPSTDWPDTLLSGTNYKHIDCNGNGVINADDTTAIIQNYSLTHAKTQDHIAGWRMTDPTLYVDLTPDTTHAGDTLYANISLGDLSIPASNVYGLAFTINYDALVVDSTKTKVTFGNSWLGNATDKISIAKDFVVNGQLKCALTRIDHTTRSGFGQIGQAQFVITTDNINGKNLAYHPMNVWISDLRVIDNLGNYISVNEGYDSSQVEFEPTEVGIDHHAEPKIGIVPNPANDMVRISVSEQLVGANLKVLDINGQVVAHVVLDATNTQISIYNYPAGIYLLQFLNEGAVITKRLVVTR